MIDLLKKYSRIQHLMHKDIKNYSETMSSTIMAFLFDLLENEKKAKGLSDREICKQIGWATGQLNQLRSGNRGRKRANLVTVLQIIKFLGLNPIEILKIFTMLGHNIDEAEILSEYIHLSPDQKQAIKNVVKTMIKSLQPAMERPTKKQEPHKLHNGQ